MGPQGRANAKSATSRVSAAQRLFPAMGHFRSLVHSPTPGLASSSASGRGRAPQRNTFSADPQTIADLGVSAAAGRHLLDLEADI
jgi:hypothetical protein